MYVAVNTVANTISLVPVKPASTPAAMNTNGNQYSIWPVKNTDFHLVNLATNKLIAKASNITIPISVPNWAPISTLVVWAAVGMIVLNAVAIPSIEFPVIRPVPVERIKKPIAVIAVPRITSEADFFWIIKPIQAINARNMAPCPNISLIIKFKTLIKILLNFLIYMSLDKPKFFLQLPSCPWSCLIQLQEP